MIGDRWRRWLATQERFDVVRSKHFSTRKKEKTMEQVRKQMLREEEHARRVAQGRTWSQARRDAQKRSNPGG